MRTHSFVLALIAVAAPAAAAQAPRPLEKVELIRLLTNPLFAQSEVADVVRRSCIGFRPTERDWADLRNAGASGEVIATVAACDNRRTASSATVRPASSSGATSLAQALPPAPPPQPPPAPPPPPPPAPPPAPPPLTAVALTSEVVANSGASSSARVMVHRSGVRQRGVILTLRGTTALGLARDASAITDDSGIAVFPLPGSNQPGTHRFEIVGPNGVSFASRPTVALTVRPAEPARVRVTPDFIASNDRAVTVLVAVTDSSGNPVREEPVELATGVGDPLTGQTDSVGRATFNLLPGALPRGGALRVRVRTLPPVDVAVADAAGLSGTATGFLATTRRGRVGSPLGEALYFRARTIQGNAATGRVVRFRAVNARVTPDSAILDSTGRVALDVTFGARAGEAMVVARMDSVEKLVTLPVEPGPIVTLVLEYGGRPVTGRRIVVPVATPFILRLTARDFYGNETPIGALGQMLKSGRAQVAAQSDLELDVVNLDVGDAAVLITLKARRLGIYDFTIGSGITASLRVEAIRAPS
jgi:hypothetical protein